MQNLALLVMNDRAELFYVWQKRRILLELMGSLVINTPLYRGISTFKYFSVDIYGINNQSSVDFPRISVKLNTHVASHGIVPGVTMSVTDVVLTSIVTACRSAHAGTDCVAVNFANSSDTT